MRLPAQRDAGCGSLAGEREEVSALEAAVAPPVPMLGPQLAGSGGGRGGTRPGCAGCGGSGAGPSTGPQRDVGASSKPVMRVKAAERGLPRRSASPHPALSPQEVVCRDLMLRPGGPARTRVSPEALPAGPVLRDVAAWHWHSSAVVAQSAGHSAACAKEL